MKRFAAKLSEGILSESLKINGKLQSFFKTLKIASCSSIVSTDSGLYPVIPLHACSWLAWKCSVV
jgi:hypothetical protein